MTYPLDPDTDAECCDRHAHPVALTLDAQRGLVCRTCDAETIAWGTGLPGRFARWVWARGWRLPD